MLQYSPNVENDGSIAAANGSKRTRDYARVRVPVCQAPELKWCYGDCTPGALDCSNFWKALKWRHDRGRTSGREKSQGLHMLQSRHPMSLDQLVTFPLCPSKCNDGSRDMVSRCPEARFSSCSWGGHSTPNITWDLGKQNCTNATRRKLIRRLDETPHGTGGTKRSNQETITSGNVIAVYYCV